MISSEALFTDFNSFGRVSDILTRCTTYKAKTEIFSSRDDSPLSEKSRFSGFLMEVAIAMILNIRSLVTSGGVACDSIKLGFSRND